MSSTASAAGTGASGQSDWCELSACAAVAAMRSGQIKAEDYAATLLDRAAQCQRLNAFISLDREQVLQAARAADKARAAGHMTGALHGLPIPVKDSVNTTALATSSGTAALRHFRPTADAPLLRALLSQGAILFGKTDMDELSYGYTSGNSLFGAVHNPYDPRYIPGGSSGGSAAAVAARIAPLAVAEDTLGSIRIPASICGLCGLRPSFGRYPNDGVLPLTVDKFDQLGPLARSVADLALFDSVVTGDHSPLSAQLLSGVRIGISPQYYLRDLNPVVEKTWSQALARLRAAGAVIVTAEIPQIATQVQEMAYTIIGHDTRPAMSGYLADQHTGISFEQMLEQASPQLQAVMTARALPPNRPSDAAYATMLAKRTQLRAAIRLYFEQNDIAVLAFPTLPLPPPLVGQDGDVDLGGKKLPLFDAMSRHVALGSCASLASLVLPAGLTADGLPVGIQFDAPMGMDRPLLALGLSLERALGPIQAPPLSERSPQYRT